MNNESKTKCQYTQKKNTAFITTQNVLQTNAVLWPQLLRFIVVECLCQRWTDLASFAFYIIFILRRYARSSPNILSLMFMGLCIGRGSLTSFLDFNTYFDLLLFFLVIIINMYIKLFTQQCRAIKQVILFLSRQYSLYG